MKRDYLVSLSPTSPLRSLEDVKNELKILKNDKNDVISITNLIEIHILICLQNQKSFSVDM